MSSSKTIPPKSLRLNDGKSGQCELVELDGESYFRINDVHRMPEFMMTLSSSGNHWMFISSFGALTAGRQDSNNALFPYYSVDKISDTRTQSGSLTIVRVEHDEKMEIWRPFFDQPPCRNHIRRNLYKSPLGNKVIFEETNDNLGLLFRYRWTFSNQSGFIRTSTLINESNKRYSIDIVDGIQNLMPYGVNQDFQLQFGNLIDAYKKNEATETGMGIYYLSSIPTDKAEPSEGLRATVVWPTQRPNRILLSTKQIETFLSAGDIVDESDERGTRGAYLTNYQFDFLPLETQSWKLVADINHDQTDVANLNARIVDNQIEEQLDIEIQECESKLANLISMADGMQCGGNDRRTYRHQSNVMFNIMRGGIPVDGYQIETSDFIDHVRSCSHELAEKHNVFLNSLPDSISRSVLITQILAASDHSLERIAREYLPLIFSRRHGDPTRPWNKFSINSHLGTADKNFDYQGNWRDIFQNWEALAHSYPQFIESMICRFVNASTADGYNPYRLTKKGFEWECPEPDNPWANIGYWCDHQIIYLSKLLEFSRRYFPNQLDELLNRDIFVFANVPYQIKNDSELLSDPRDTVKFDRELDKEIDERVAEIGIDGKLLPTSDNKIHFTNLFEKLLLTGLVKISNFVPDGGIWLNTQRPEWNDANNALVGYGLSVVTTCYLRRYFDFLATWFSRLELEHFEISEELENLLQKIKLAFSPHLEQIDIQISNAERFQIVKDLANAGSNYRQRIYEQGFSGRRKKVSTKTCCEFLRGCIRMLEATVRSNLRSDGLYHSYNLMSQDVDQEISVERLYEMLEGQVAVLSSGLLSIEESIKLLDNLKSSQLFRADQNSYMLYPNRDLPTFCEKNLIPTGLINQSTLLQQFLKNGEESIVKKDLFGNCHFNGDFRNRKDVELAVARLKNCPKYASLIDENSTQQIGSIFENMFCHHQFTGRSGTFFAYEGLGSIYWHMVSKLSLAVAELYREAENDGADRPILEALKTHFDLIRDGIGAEKTANHYGAFPTDPYSHTPENNGAKQPGMTGQVKEDVISRFIELGLRVKGGCISFNPSMFDNFEFNKPGASEPVRSKNKLVQLINNLDSPAFAYTVCGVPVIYIKDGNVGLRIIFANGQVYESDSLDLSEEHSDALFNRSGEIDHIEVRF